MWNRSKTESFTGMALSYNFDCYRLFLRQIKEKQQSIYNLLMHFIIED